VEEQNKQRRRRGCRRGVDVSFCSPRRRAAVAAHTVMVTVGVVGLRSLCFTSLSLTLTVEASLYLRNRGENSVESSSTRRGTVAALVSRRRTMHRATGTGSPPSRHSGRAMLRYSGMWVAPRYQGRHRFHPTPVTSCRDGTGSRAGAALARSRSFNFLRNPSRRACVRLLTASSHSAFPRAFALLACISLPPAFRAFFPCSRGAERRACLRAGAPEPCDRALACTRARHHLWASAHRPIPPPSHIQHARDRLLLRAQNLNLELVCFLSSEGAPASRGHLQVTSL
jgi:hypothetical protein